MSNAAVILVALLIDAAISWPSPIYSRIGHPVTWIGRFITALETRLNTGENRRLKGTAAALVIIISTTSIAALIEAILAGIVSNQSQYIIICAIFAWPFIATRSMYEHVKAVANPLKTGDISAARSAVSMIVGRDPSLLDENGVARAAIESLAENSSDGIVAPVFWGIVAGLPGIAAYKAINTLDSMIGHRTPRFEQFGWAAAKIDDLVNLIPARLTGFLFALVSGRFRESMRCMAIDARHHRSPNAGWPESAMAGALGIRLSGPRVYDGKIAQERWVNEHGVDPNSVDLQRGLALYLRAMILLAFGVAILGMV